VNLSIWRNRPPCSRKSPTSSAASWSTATATVR
jgi:hypothetical protein